jgi:hypothetical protein
MASNCVLYFIRRGVCKGLAKSGDFSCQYGMTILLLNWLGWVDPKVGQTFVNKVFSYIKNRQILLDHQETDLDLVSLHYIIIPHDCMLRLEFRRCGDNLCS